MEKRIVTLQLPPTAVGAVTPQSHIGSGSVSAAGSQNASRNEPLDLSGTSQEHDVSHESQAMQRSLIEQYYQQPRQEQSSFESGQLSGRLESPLSDASHQLSQFYRANQQHADHKATKQLSKFEEGKEEESKFGEARKSISKPNEFPRARMPSFIAGQPTTPEFKPHENDVSPSELALPKVTVQVIGSHSSNSALQPREVHVFSHHADTALAVSMALECGVKQGNYDGRVNLSTYIFDQKCNPDLSSLKQALKNPSAVVVFETNLGVRGDDVWVVDENLFADSVASVILFNGGEGKYAETGQKSDSLKQTMDGRFLGYFTSRVKIVEFLGNKLIETFKEKDPTK